MSVRGRERASIARARRTTQRRDGHWRASSLLSLLLRASPVNTRGCVAHPPTLRPARRTAHGDEWTRTIDASLALRVINYEEEACHLIFNIKIIIIIT